MPTVFFATELAGEEPLSAATAQALLPPAVSLGRREPWKMLHEGQLIFVSVPGSDEPYACSIMGALGEVLAVVAYPGAVGYHFFRKLHTGDGDRDSFLGTMRCLRAEWVPRRELKKPDRELLAAAAPALPKGRPVPQFRSMRPGYFPWYINEFEGRMLAVCLTALDEFFAEPLFSGMWDREGIYPLLDSGELRAWKPRTEAFPMPAPAPVDEERVARFLAVPRKRGGTLELDHFYGHGGIAEPHCRPAFPHVAMAADAQSGIAFPPHVVTPETPLGELLAEALWQALDVHPGFPTEVRVRDTDLQALLAPLAGALGIRLRVSKSMRALDEVKQSLLHHVF